MLLDDAAISFRYAERLCSGKGFTYNDHERVLGASNPLYVLVLSVSCRANVPIETSARAVGFVSYVLIVAMVVLVCARLSGTVGGAVSGLVVATDAYFRFQVLGGMEVGLELMLAMGAVAGVTHGRFVVAGVMAGLAMWTKLDAGALVAAITFAAFWYTKQFPYKFLIACIVTLIPWLLWSTLYFGSPIPHSVSIKLNAGEGQPFDPLWIARFLLEPSRRFVLLASISACFVAMGRAAMVAAILVAWAVIHGAAYSFVNLGAPYPWYPTALVVSLAALAGLGAGAVVQRLTSIGARDLPVTCAAALCALALVNVLASVPPQWQQQPVRTWELFEADRKAAGTFLRTHGAPTEVLECAYGWPAFASQLPTNDSSRLNSREHLGPVAYRVEHGYPLDRGGQPPVPPPGMIALATFDSAHRQNSEYSWFVVFGRPTSLIARTQNREPTK